MPGERTVQRAKAAGAERRPPVASVLARRAAVPSLSPARAIQERLGNHGAQALIARSMAAPSREARTGPGAAKVSKPTDRAELEAEETARKVGRMRDMPATPAAVQGGKSKGVVQRAQASASAPAAPAVANVSGGAPLPSAVRSHMEPRFGASFANVRVHTGESAARQSAALNANAFTIGQHIFFGRNQFQPQSAGGQHLIAHELTHTVQQGAAVQRDVLHRSPLAVISERASPHVQRDFLGIPSPREYFARQAAGIPGFTMLTVVIGFNPITNARVERTPANILKGAIQLMPGGVYITDALNAHGLLERVGAWVAAQFETLKDIGAELWKEIESFIDKFSLTDLADPGGLWDRARAIVDRPIARIIAFAKAVRDDVIKLIKDAVLKPIAAFAQSTRGYPLLCAVMGKDPITGEPVPRNANTLLAAFLKFIGEEPVWEAIQKANAIPRTFAWFNAAVEALRGFVAEIPPLFMQALKALDVADIILIPRAFVKLAGVFGGFAGRFITWGATAVWNLLEIVFDVVSPAALVYIKKTGAALKSILRNPLPFVGNLVRAAKLGFLNFADHFLTHLKTGLIDWLTGSLPGIYIPKAFSLVEIAKFTFSVLGLTWANIRQKLVKATSETLVKALETGFDIVVTLVRDGPAAAWDKIKEQLSNLKDMVIGGITDFVVDTVVKKAIPKLVSMFIPGAGFVSAILSIYDTIMVFVNKISQIIQVVTGFIDSIVAIAAGAIAPAAARVESILANLLSLAISFLAGFVGLGKVADKILGVVAKIRAPIDKALDSLIAWIVKMAKSLFAKGKAALGKIWDFATSTFKDEEGAQHTLYVNDSGGLMVKSVPKTARAFVEWYVKEKGGDPKIAAQAYPLISQAETLAAAIEKSTTKAGGVPAPAKQKQLLDINNKISALLSKLVSGDTDLGKTMEKYALEGAVGTYATVPKAVGDQLTPDHQPQASLILAAADFFKKKLGIDGGPLAERAESRAAQGYAINLHFKRHVAGATYGGKGEKRESFFSRLVTEAGGQKKGDAKATVVKMLKAALKVDVKAMKDVAKEKLSHEAWSQLKKEFGTDAKAEKARKQISDQIVKGEDQMASQPFDF